MNKLTLVATLGLTAALILGGAAGSQSSAGVILVPNGDFETLYKPGTAITGHISDGGWSLGVGPDCPIDSGEYIFDDGTTGDVADIPGWIDVDTRDPFPPYQHPLTPGAIASQANHTEGGRQCYWALGAHWGDADGGLIVSDAPLATVQSGLSYTLSMVADGYGSHPATPVVLELLADGRAIEPSSSVQPVLGDGAWLEVSRTYDLASLAGSVGEDLTIRLGVGREADGTQSRFDDVSLIAVPEPSTLLLAVVGLLSLVWHGWRRR